MTNAKFIDSIIDTKLRSYNQRPIRLRVMKSFVRRAYLKIIGRIPSYGETKAFLTDRGQIKEQAH